MVASGFMRDRRGMSAHAVNAPMAVPVDFLRDDELDNEEPVQGHSGYLLASNKPITGAARAHHKPFTALPGRGRRPYGPPSNRSG
jgi:hypothetical protein